MQAFVNLTLFALLLVISATAATSLSPTAITGNTAAAPVTTPAPAGGSNPTPALITPAPAGGNNLTPAQAGTAAPGGGNSTAAPGGGNSTAAPGGGNSTAAPGGGNSTAAPGGGNSTAAPGGGNSTAALTDLCQVNTCTGGSYCVSLNNIHFCQCLHGYYYNYSRCEKGKVFPGIIQVKTPDTSDLENKKSINYEKLHKEVTKFFKDAFKSSDYGQTIIEQVSVSAPARSQMRADDKVVNVTVVNLFAEDTKENEMTILNTINSAISSNPSFANYTNQDRCEFYGCVKKDNCSNGFQCECQEGYERPNPYTATCLPLSRRCPYACNSKPNTQCLVKDKGSPECVCQAGYKMDDHEQCQACAFGYNGVNCEDNFELILTVLGTIAGILILGMVIALIFMRSKKMNDIEEQNLIENDFQNLKLQQTTGFSSPAEGSIFPKIRASFPRDSGMQNPYANPRGIPRPDY